MKVVLDNEGYVALWCDDNTDFPNEEAITVQQDITEDFMINFSAYKMGSGKLVVDNIKLQAIKDEAYKNELRRLREEQCFPVINRGTYWYDMITYEQKEELRQWYIAWLNVTDTLEIPTMPSWI